MTERDYCRVLELREGADLHEVKAAFRRLARRYHPDVNPGDPQAETLFKEINEAYQVLSRRRAVPQTQQAAPATGFDWLQWVGAPQD